MIAKEKVVYVPGSTSLIDYIKDGKTICFNETLEQVQLRHPGAVEMSLDEAVRLVDKAIIEAYVTEPVEVTEDRYMEMLEILPPMKWKNGTFMMSELLCSHYTSIFCQIGSRYFEMVDSAFLSAEEIIDRVKQSKAFTAASI